jgi:hypothetical protein
MWDRRKLLYRGLEPAAAPREAVDRLIARGIHLYPEGPYRVTRTRIRRPDPETGHAPPPESEEITVAGPPVTIDTATIVFRKQREVGGRHLFALSYEQTLNHLAPDRRVEAGSLIVAERTGRGWFASAGCGLPTGRRPDMTEPFVSVAAGWNRELGYRAAMQVHPGTANITAVRLRFAVGATAEADTEGDLALFLVDHPTGVTDPDRAYTPDAVELLSGLDVIATQKPRQRPSGR